MKSNLNYLLSMLLVVLFFNCKDTKEQQQVEPSNATVETATDKKQGQAFIADDGSAPNVLQIAIGSKDHTTLVAAVQAANLENVNYELLQSQISLAENKGTISELLAQIFARTDQDEVGVFDSLYDIKNKLNKIAELSLQFSEINQRFEENYIELKDTLFQLQNEAENIDTNSEDLLALQEQNDRINALFLKHKVSEIDDLLQLKNELSAEQSSFVDLETKISSLEKEIISLENSLEKQTKVLTKRGVK